MRKFYELARHHLAFNEECLQKNVFPLGIRAFATCATLGADDTLKTKYVEILTRTSTELTIANVQHLHKVATQTNSMLDKIEKELDSVKNEVILSQWRNTQTTSLEHMTKLQDALQEKRKKKIQKTVQAHKANRIYTEECLRTRTLPSKLTPPDSQREVTTPQVPPQPLLPESTRPPRPTATNTKTTHLQQVPPQPLLPESTCPPRPTATNTKTTHPQHPPHPKVQVPVKQKNQQKQHPNPTPPLNSYQPSRQQKQQYNPTPIIPPLMSLRPQPTYKPNIHQPNHDAPSCNPLRRNTPLLPLPPPPLMTLMFDNRWPLIQPWMTPVPQSLTSWPYPTPHPYYPPMYQSQPPYLHPF